MQSFDSQVLQSVLPLTFVARIVQLPPNISTTALLRVSGFHVTPRSLTSSVPAAVASARPGRDLLTFCSPWITVEVTAVGQYDSNNNPIVTGVVTIQNQGIFGVITQSQGVTVTLANNVVVEPIIVQASCPGSVISGNSQVSCSYVASLPTSGIAQGFSAWPTATAMARFIAGSQCSSGAVDITPPSNPAAPTCSDVLVSTTASVGASGTVTGTVTLTAQDSLTVIFQSVQVMLANNVPVAPIYVTASCPGISVEPGSSIQCPWVATLPANGIASSPSQWPTATANVLLGGSSDAVKCYSPATNIQQLLMG
eukprot:jgi/Chrzof1/14883/Cz09g19140.t1